MRHCVGGTPSGKTWWLPCASASGAGLDAHAWQLAHSLMYLFRLRGRTGEWIATYEIALESAARLGDDEARAHLLFDLGAAHFQSGQYECTVRNQEWALRLFEEIDDHYWLSLTLISLGEAHVELGGFDQAQQGNPECVGLWCGRRFPLGRCCWPLASPDVDPRRPRLLRGALPRRLRSPRKLPRIPWLG